MSTPKKRQQNLCTHSGEKKDMSGECSLGLTNNLGTPFRRLTDVFTGKKAKNEKFCRRPHPVGVQRMKSFGSWNSGSTKEIFDIWLRSALPGTVGTFHSTLGTIAVD